jgi:bifunctional non-homologous end joining protein LigD
VSSASGFVHELKYRVQAHQHDGRVRLYTRSGLDWNNRFPTIAADVGRLPASKIVIDGEVISADAQGRPNFSTLQDDLKQRRYDRMVYYAFDLLHLDGFDTRAAPLIERKKVLQSFLLEAARRRQTHHLAGTEPLAGLAATAGRECRLSQIHADGDLEPVLNWT